jgi:hypothetical protein
MTVTEAIERAQENAKRQIIKSRLLRWLDRAETVDITKESPGMERTDCSALARLQPTGTLVIELRLTGIDGIEARVKDGGDCHKPEDWIAVQAHDVGGGSP